MKKKKKEIKLEDLIGVSLNALGLSVQKMWGVSEYDTLLGEHKYVGFFIDEKTAREFKKLSAGVDVEEKFVLTDGKDFGFVIEATPMKILNEQTVIDREESIERSIKNYNKMIKEGGGKKAFYADLFGDKK